MPRRFSTKILLEVHGDDTHSGVIFTPFVKGKGDRQLKSH